MSDPTDESLVYVVDDDQAVRDSLQLLLTSSGLNSRAFADGPSFLAEYSADMRGCMICDLKMPGLTGLELQARLRGLRATLPIIFLTGHGDIPDAVHAMKGGAVDFVQKPFDAEQLLNTVRDALAQERRNHEDAEARSALIVAYGELTTRERQVAGRVAEGLANKVVAEELGISERTVEVHRSRIMHKMGAQTLPELVRMFEVLGDAAC